MAIEIECDCCRTTIRVRDEMAGRTGLCRQCGSSITIPKPDGLLAEKRLLDATPEEMLQELRRRRLRGVLLLFDAAGGGPIDSDQLPPSGQTQRGALRAIGARDFDQKQLAEVYRHLADVADRRADAHETVEQEVQGDVFDLKGDQLGMSLADFKQKHARRVDGSNKIAPWCSDELPGRAVPELFAESWHVAAGIVHARVDYPEENSSPTIAGVETDGVIYQFIDNKLFQITAFFRPDAFHQVGAALRSKFGAPHNEKPSPRQDEWWTMSSTINLRQGLIRPPTPTILAYAHDELIRVASDRKPNNAADL